MKKDIKWFYAKSLLTLKYPDLLIKRIYYNINMNVSDVLSAFKYYDYPYRIIFIAGMPMSATTWMKNMIARIPGYYTRLSPMPFDVEYNQNYCDAGFKKVPAYGYSLFKTHLNPTEENLNCIFKNGVEKVLITYRDLRDVAVSRYYRLIDFPKPITAYDYVDYRSIEKEIAIDHSIEVVSSHYVPWIKGWLEVARNDPERYLFVKFEDLKTNTFGIVKQVLDFYCIKLSDNKINKIINESKGKGTIKENMLKARILPWGYSSNFRSGKINGWKKELSMKHIKKCKDLFGPDLIKLGYEKNLNW